MFSKKEVREQFYGRTRDFCHDLDLPILKEHQIDYLWAEFELLTNLEDMADDELIT